MARSGHWTTDAVTDTTREDQPLPQGPALVLQSHPELRCNLGESREGKY